MAALNSGDINSGQLQYELTSTLADGEMSVGEAALSHFSPIDGRGARKSGHSSPAGAGSVGPSALDRRSTTSCSSVRSHRAVRSQRSALRRHHCRPPAPFGAIWQRLRASAGRLPSLRAAGQRFWPVREGPAHSRRARQRARNGALSRARALRPCAAAFLRPDGRRAVERVRA